MAIQPSAAASTTAKDKPQTERQRPIPHPQVWTAAKCQRVLRPIETAVQTLRKFSVTRSSVRQLRLKNEKHTTEEDLPEWARGEEPSAPLKTYARYGGQPPSMVKDSPFIRRSAAVGIELPTPVAVRMYREIGASEEKNVPPIAVSEQSWEQILAQLPLTDRVDIHDSQSSDLTTRDLEQLRKSHPVARQQVHRQRSGIASVDMTIRTLQRSLRNLFPPTCESANSHPEATGARSLLAMCMRKVPDSIKLEQDVARADTSMEAMAAEEQAHTISSDTYTDIELVPGVRIYGLLAIARSHAVKILEDAISDSCFTEQECWRLITAAFECGAHEEAKMMFSALLRVQVLNECPKTLKSEILATGPSQTLAYLLCIKEQYAEHKYFYETLADLFVSGRLSSTWLGTTQISRIFKAALSAASDKDVYDSPEMAFCLLILEGYSVHWIWEHNVFSRDKQTFRWSLRSFFKSFCEKLTTLCFMKQYEFSIHKHCKSFKHSEERTKLLRRLLKILVRAQENRYDPDFGYIFGAFSTLVCHLDNKPKDEGLNHLLGSTCDLLFFRNVLENLQTVYKMIGLHLAGILNLGATTYNIQQSSGLLRYLLESMAQFLEAWSCDAGIRYGQRNTLSFILRTTAYDSAEARGDQRYWDLVRQFEARMLACNLMQHSAAELVAETPKVDKSTSSPQYRYDEGLSEWVTKTPAPNTLESLGAAQLKRKSLGGQIHVRVSGEYRSLPLINNMLVAEEYSTIQEELPAPSQPRSMKNIALKLSQRHEDTEDATSISSQSSTASRATRSSQTLSKTSVSGASEASTLGNKSSTISLSQTELKRSWSIMANDDDDDEEMEDELSIQEVRRPRPRQSLPARPPLQKSTMFNNRRSLGAEVTQREGKLNGFGLLQKENGPAKRRKAAYGFNWL